MESESDNLLSAEAQAQLRHHDDMRAKVERRGPSRAYATLLLWGALATSAYTGVYLFAFGGQAPGGLALDDATSGVNSFTSTMLLLFPILVFSSMVSGARERFSIRRKTPIGYAVTYAIILAGFMALGTLTVIGIAYPWWLNLIVPAALFVAMAVGPVRQLVGAGAVAKDEAGVDEPGVDEHRVDERWVNEPLTRHAQRNTALIGVAAGLLAAASTQQWFAILAVVTMLAFLAVTIGWSASWGIPRTGYEWGPLHWIALGVIMTVLFVLAFLLARTTMVTTPIAVTVGALIFAVMVTASLLPRRSRR